MRYEFARGKHKGYYLVDSGRSPKIGVDDEPDLAASIMVLFPQITSFRMRCADESLVLEIEPELGLAASALLTAHINSHKAAEQIKIDLTED